MRNYHMVIRFNKELHFTVDLCSSTTIIIANTTTKIIVA